MVFSLLFWIAFCVSLHGKSEKASETQAEDPSNVSMGHNSGFVWKSRVMSPETLFLTYTDGIWDKRYGTTALGSHFGKPEGGLQLGNQMLLL